MREGIEQNRDRKKGGRKKGERRERKGGEEKRGKWGGRVLTETGTGWKEGVRRERESRGKGEIEK